MNDLLRTVTRVLLSVLWIAQCEGKPVRVF